MTKPNEFGKYQILINADTATAILEQVRGMDYSTLTKEQVWAFNALQLNLEAIEEVKAEREWKEKVESLIDEVEA